MADNTEITAKPERLISPSDILKPAFVMCPPFSLGAHDDANVEKIFHQFLSVYTFISSNALVYLLPYRDGLRIADLGVKLPHLDDQTIILSRISDGKETISNKQFFEMMGYKVTVPPQAFYGEADLKWLGHNVYVGCFGEQTDIAALSWLHDTFDMKIIPVRSTKGLLHLNHILFPTKPNSAIVVEGAIEPKVLKAIEKYTEVTLAPKELGFVGVTSCIRATRLVLAGSNINDLKKTDDTYELEAKKILFLEKVCAKQALEPVVFNISEYSKFDVGLSAIFMHLNHVDYMTTAET